MTEKGPAYLPGDPAPKGLVDRIIRVDQAGEFGAVRIYAGQRSVIRKGRAADLIDHMAEQEARHLATFNRLAAPLSDMGYDIEVRELTSGLQGVRVSPDGQLDGGADPRREGVVVAVD